MASNKGKPAEIRIMKLVPDLERKNLETFGMKPPPKPSSMQGAAPKPVKK